MKETATKEIGTRIKELIFKLDLNQTSFAKAVGVSQNAIFNTVSGNTQPRLVLIDSILKAYPKVNKTWLLEGTGEMFLDEPSVAPADNYLQEHLKNLENQFAEMRAMFSSQIAVKDRQIERLMDLLGKLDDVVGETKTVLLNSAIGMRA